MNIVAGDRLPKSESWRGSTRNEEGCRRRSSPQVLQAALLRVTLAPFLRGSESPMAIACLRLFTRPPFPPLPERQVPLFLRRMALATLLPAALPYLRPPDFLEPFLAAIDSSFIR